MVVHAVVDKGSPSVVCPYPPTPQNSLFFYIDDPIKVKPANGDSFMPQPRSVVVGPQLNGVLLDIDHSHKAVRVGFHPGGLHRLIGLPLCEAIDGSYDAADIFGSDIERLNDRLQDCLSFDTIKEEVEKFLLQKAGKVKSILPFDMAMLKLMKQGGNMGMDTLSSLACLSIRQFERVSKERIGFSPKLFARLVRFSKAYRMREQIPQLTWTDIAHRCGYFDQMHFIRDFKQFTGIAPGIMDMQIQQAPAALQASLNL